MTKLTKIIQTNKKKKTSFNNAGVGGSSPPITTIHRKGFMGLLLC
jgi:hypothetical protein